MSKNHLITKDEAAMIEKENALTKGTFAYDRPATAAEIIYLKEIAPISPLSFHLDFLPGIDYLVVVELSPKYSHESYFEINYNMLCFGRSRVNSEIFSRDFALNITRICENINHSSTLSVKPSRVRNIFRDAPRALLLRPTFAKIPPTEYEESSPGLCIKDLHVREVMHVNLLTFHRFDNFHIINAEKFDEILRNQNNFWND